MIIIIKAERDCAWLWAWRASGDAAMRYSRTFLCFALFPTNFREGTIRSLKKVAVVVRWQYQVFPVNP